MLMANGIQEISLKQGENSKFIKIFVGIIKLLSFRLIMTMFCFCFWQFIFSEKWLSKMVLY